MALNDIMADNFDESDTNIESFTTNDEPDENEESYDYDEGDESIRSDDQIDSVDSFEDTEQNDENNGREYSLQQQEKCDAGKGNGGAQQSGQINDCVEENTNVPPNVNENNLNRNGNDSLRSQMVKSVNTAMLEDGEILVTTTIDDSGDEIEISYIHGQKICPKISRYQIKVNDALSATLPFQENVCFNRLLFSC